MFVYYIQYANGKIQKNIIEYFGEDTTKTMLCMLKKHAIQIARNY